MFRLLGLAFVAFVFATPNSSHAQDSGSLLNQVEDANPMDRESVFDLYNQKTWQWDSGGGYFSDSGRFLAYTDDVGKERFSIGNWTVSASGEMCINAFWISASDSSYAESCYRHRSMDGAILQRSPKGVWYVFKSSESAEDDEFLKLKAGDLVTEGYKRSRKVVTDAAPSELGGIYQVKSGDTLAKISQAVYGDNSRVLQIIAAAGKRAQSNTALRPLENPDLLYLGEKIWLPLLDLEKDLASQKSPKSDSEHSEGGQTHIVRPGETLRDVSIAYYGTARRVKEIIAANANKVKEDSSFFAITDPELLFAGEKIWIPNLAN